jgi:4-hydroxybenzoate polyprenyltransferase
MDRNQSPMTVQGSVARRVAMIAALLLAGVAGALTLPIWTAAMVMLVALVAMLKLATPEPVAVPVVNRRDSRR